MENQVVFNKLEQDLTRLIMNHQKDDGYLFHSIEDLIKGSNEKFNSTQLVELLKLAINNAEKGGGYLFHSINNLIKGSNEKFNSTQLVELLKLAINNAEKDDGYLFHSIEELIKGFDLTAPITSSQKESLIKLLEKKVSDYYIRLIKNAPEKKEISEEKEKEIEEKAKENSQSVILELKNIFAIVGKKLEEKKIEEKKIEEKEISDELANAMEKEYDLCEDESRLQIAPQEDFKVISRFPNDIKKEDENSSKSNDDTEKTTSEMILGEIKLQKMVTKNIPLS